MTEEFRQGFGRGLTVFVAGIALVGIVVVAVTSGVTATMLSLPWLLLLVVGSWAVFWRPSVVVSDAGVRLVNVTRTIDIPWPAVQDVQTRFALTLITTYGRFTSWAAPAPGAGSALRSSMRLRTPARTVIADGDGSSIETSTVGEMEGTASGDAAMIVRRRWERLRDGGFLDDPRLEFDRAPTHWHVGVGAAMLGLAALSAATLFLG